MYAIVLLSLLYEIFLGASETFLSDTEAPLRYSSVSARSFDVIPDTGEDMGSAFRIMLQTVIAAGEPVEITLESGKYRIGGGPSHNTAITVQGASHLIIRGAGADTEIILMEPRQGGFFVIDGTDVWITDMAVDHDPVPYTQGQIMLVNAEEGWFDLITQEGYPTLTEPWFKEAPKPYGQWGMIFDSKAPKLKAGVSDFVFMDSWEQLGRRAWRMYPVKEQRERLREMQYGDRFVHMARHGRGGAAFFYKCRECGVRNLAVYASQSLAVGSIASDRITVEGMKIERRPGTDRLLTTNSDGVHCQQNLRGPIIENCVFESMADDSVNIYYYPNSVTGVVSETVIRASRQGVIEEGNLLQFFEPRVGRVLAEVEVAEVGEAPDGDYRITLSRPVSDIKAAPNGHSIYNLSRCGADYVIRNNVFRNHRRHGMMLKAPQGLVEKNTLEGLGGMGIVAGNDPEWPEGVIPFDVTIRGNTIKDVGRSRWYGQDTRGAAIQIMTRASGGRVAAERCFHDVVLEENTIVNPPGAALYIGASRNVSIEGLHVLYEESGAMPRDAAAVVVDNAAAILVDRLTVESAQPGVTAGVFIGETVDAGESGITLKAVKISGKPGVAVTDDRRGTVTQ